MRDGGAFRPPCSVAQFLAFLSLNFSHASARSNASLISVRIAFPSQFFNFPPRIEIPHNVEQDPVN